MPTYLLHHSEAVNPDLIKWILDWVNHVIGININLIIPIIIIIMIIPVLLICTHKLFKNH
jgi:hypothetical protein